MKTHTITLIPGDGVGPETATPLSRSSKPPKRLSMMLCHLGHIDLAGRIEQACYDMIECKQHITFDLGGTATTSEFAQAIIERL